MEPIRKTSNLQILFRALGTVGLLCILGGFAYAVYYAAFSPAAYAVIGFGLLLFLLLFIKAEIANLKYYLHVFVYSAMVFGICLFAYLYARQYTVQKDLTKQHLYSLSDASANYIKNLDRETSITIMSSDSVPFRDLLSLYAPAGKKLKWQFMDPRKNVEARKFGEVVRPMDVFVVSGQNKKKMSVVEITGANSESAITNAIIEVTRDTKPKLYFLSGHGEVAFEQTPRSRQRQEASAPSLAAVRKFLNDRGMETEKLNLAKTNAVPQDASALVIAGPVTDLLPPEVSAVDQYLQNGGKGMILVDIPQGQSTPPLTNLNGLLSKFGVSAPQKIIIDAEAAQFTGKPEIPMASWFNPDQPITKSLGDNRILLSPSRPIEQAGSSPNGLTVVDLVKTGDRSFAVDFASVLAGQRFQPPPQNEWKGQTIGVAVSKPPPPGLPNMPRQPKDDSANGTKLVVFGTASLIQDDLLATQQPAVQLMLNTINWLTEQADQIDVAPRQVEGTPIILNNAQIRLIFAFSVLLLPALLFFGGVSYSLARRKR